MALHPLVLCTVCSKTNFCREILMAFSTTIFSCQTTVIIIILFFLIGFFWTKVDLWNLVRHGIKFHWYTEESTSIKRAGLVGDILGGESGGSNVNRISNICHNTVVKRPHMTPPSQVFYRIGRAIMVLKVDDWCNHLGSDGGLYQVSRLGPALLANFS